MRNDGESLPRNVGIATRRTNTPAKWYQLPLVWLAIAMFLASLAGCIGMVIAAGKYSDETLSVSGDQLLKMPATRTPGPAQ